MTHDKTTDRRKIRGQTRRAAVLKAARKLFVKHGYRGTTLAQIIAIAGGSRETIYQTLGGKTGIFAAIVADVGERLAESVVRPDSLKALPEEGLTRLGLDLIELWNSAEARAMHRVVLSEGVHSPELIDAWYRGGSALTIAALSRYLAAQRDGGRLRDFDPELVARQFIGLLMCEVAFPIVARDHHPVSSDEKVRRCVNLVLRAYTPAT